MTKVPSHVAIILDGNRRYARKKSLRPGEGHRSGAKNIENIIDWALELGIKELTLYCFSIENFNRPKTEVNVLFNLFREHIDKLEKDERVYRNKVKVGFIGRLNKFPRDVQAKMDRLMNKTKAYQNFKLNFAMAYGGRAEIVDAVKNIIKRKIKKIDEKTISKNLYIEDEPDLVIRTGGEHRISNFLIWQAYYSEWYFSDKLWPEFSKKDLIKAINSYKKRKRRFGR